MFLCYTLFYIKFKIKEMSKGVVLTERSGIKLPTLTKSMDTILFILYYCLKHEVDTVMIAGIC
jgi:hypothetical protein